MKPVLLFYERHRSIILCYLATFILLAAVSFYRPGFGLGDVGALRSLAREAAVIGLISLGQTFVIMTGGIDLSLPWVLTGSAVIMTMLTQGNDGALIWAVPAVLAISLMIGWINGWVITKFEVSPVIVTLSMNGILSGAISGLAGGNAGIQGQYGVAPPFVVEVARGRLFGVPNLVWMLAALCVVGSIVLSLTPFGRRVYAIGTSPTVSLYSGINVRRMTVQIYMLSALCAGVAGILLTGKAGNAYLGMGDPYLFISVATVAIGGASVLGGTGHVVGTVGGAAFLAVLTATIPILQLPRAYQLIMFGLVILVAVYFAASRSVRQA